MSASARALLIAVVAAVLAATACSGAGAGVHAAAGGAAPRPSGSAAEAAPAASSSGQSPSATAAAGQAAGAPAASPSALRLPVAGSYAATLTRNGASAVATVAYQVGQTAGGATPVTVTVTNGDGSQLINQYRWQPDGIYLVETSIVTRSQRYDCPFRSPMLQLPLPLRVGSAWSATGTCTTAPPTSATTTVNLSASVVGTAWQTVGGMRVAAYEIRGKLSTETTGSYAGGLTVGPTPYDLKSTSDLTDYFDPGAGLDVHEVSVSTSSSTQAQTTTDLRLDRLQPG